MNREEFTALCNLYGTSGREDAVREYILNELQKLDLPEDAVSVDRLGNIIVHRRGKQPAKRRVLFSAHMDEVALIVTAVNPDGSLSFDTVGGVQAAAVIGRQVTVGAQRISGVIGAKPVHLLSAEAKKRPAGLSSLFCDIGAADKAEAEQYVRPGDILYFPENAHGSLPYA